MTGVSYWYSVPYIVVFLLLCCLYWKERKGYAPAGKIAFFVLLLFIGLRGHVYTDYISYYPFFKELPVISDLDLDSFTFEPGFVVYSSVIKTIFPNYFVWVFINTLIDLSVFYWAFKKCSVSIAFSFIIFFVFGGTGLEFNLYRNVKAIDLFLLSLPYLKERKLLPYLFLNILGCTFHTSSLVFIPLYFILTKHIPKYLQWGSFIVVNVLFFCRISLSGLLLSIVVPLLGMEHVTDKITDYLISGEEYGLTIGYLERSCSCMLFMLFYNQLSKQNPYNRIFCNSFLVYFVLFHLFADIGVFAGRFSILFIYAYWILYPNVLGIMRRNNRRLVLCLLFVYSLLKLMVMNDSIITQYDNLLWGIRPFEERRGLFEAYY